MNAPNPALCDAFGTKVASSPIGSSIAAALMGYGAMEADQAHLRRLMAEAHAMDQAIREQEARRMFMTHHSMNVHHGGVVGDQLNMAGLGGFDAAFFKGGSDLLGETAAELAKEGMDKEAIGSLMSMLPGLARGASKLLGQGGSKLMTAAGNSGGRLGKLMGSAGQKMTAAGNKLRGPSAAFSKGPPAPVPKGPTASTAHRQVSPWQAKGEQLIAQREAGQKALAQQAKNVQGAPKAPSLGASKAQAPNAAGAAGASGGKGGGGMLDRLAAGADGKSKPLVGWKTKAKLMGGLGLAATGYAGMKGLQSARDYMMVPSGIGGWGVGNIRHPGQMHNVSQYGYPY